MVLLMVPSCHNPPMTVQKCNTLTPEQDVSSNHCKLNSQVHLVAVAKKVQEACRLQGTGGTRHIHCAFHMTFEQTANQIQP